MLKRSGLTCLLLALFTLTLFSAPLKSDKYDPLITASVQMHQPDQPDNFFWHKGRIQAESSFDPYAVSPIGAMGLCQFIKATADWMGIDPWIPAEAIDGMVRYTNFIDKYYSDRSSLYTRAETVDKQMIIDAGYNWRMDRITRLCRTYSWRWDVLVLRLPLETQRYSPVIQKYAKEFRKKTYRV